jgi:hypothetical protein
VAEREESGARRWVSVTFNEEARETQYLQGLAPGNEVVWLFLEGRTILDAAQDLEDAGRTSPREVDAGGTLTWAVEGSVVVSARLEAPRASSGFPSVIDARLVEGAESSPAPLQVDAVALADERAADVIPYSTLFIDGCSDYTTEELEQVRRCATQAAAASSVGEWLDAVGVGPALFDGGVCLDELSG